MTTQHLQAEEIVPFMAQHVEQYGAGTFFMGNRVFDVSITQITTTAVVFVAWDQFGDAVATAQFSSHLFDNLDTPEAIVDYLNDVVYDALCDSYALDGRTVLALQ